LTKELIDSGIAIHFDDSIDLVPKIFSSKTLWLLLLLLFLATFRVELFYGARIHIKKRAEVLGIITKDTFVLLLRERTGKQQPLVF
jgi:UDP-N-acetylmuramate--alanine ligase